MVIHGTLPPVMRHFTPLMGAFSWHFTPATDSSFQIVLPIVATSALWKTFPANGNKEASHSKQHGGSSAAPKPPPPYAHAARSRPLRAANAVAFGQP